MDRDDIIRMAREAGWDLEWGGTTIEQVQNFANLVAEREREECAAICDTEADEFGGMSDGFYAAKNCAEAIHARGGK